MQYPTIRFHGAAGTVTGSCFVVETEAALVVVDCGLFQGSKTEKELNYRVFPFDIKAIDAVILSHAHIDHSGLLPKLAKHGYEGQIYATPGTVDLCSVMLPDSGHIQEVEVDHLNRRNRLRARRFLEPIYTANDAHEMLHQFHSVPLERWQTVAQGIRVRFWNAGHLLGSASVEMEIGDEHSIRVLFSGDIGPTHKLLQTVPEGPANWDYVICESTYGDTDRIDATDMGRRKILRDEVRAANRHHNGALIIPSFAVERTQELLADLFFLMERSEIPSCPIVIDSPLAMRASQIFQAHERELEHGDLLARAMRSKNVRFTESVEQSKALDHMHGFHIVIAASGMCEAGRIRHRLKNWLWREEGTVLLVGFQAAGTLGRILADGASTVRIQGEEIAVRARIRTIDAYSGHADGPELQEWVRNRLPIARAIFLVHGEDEALVALKIRLMNILPENRIYIPRLDSAFRLDPDGPVDISPTRPPPRIDPGQAGHRDWNNDYQVLLQDLQDQLRDAADDRSRGVIIRKIRRALEL
ncbi:MAG TPA: MBL fold metallo-hydrolase [Pararhizobium sp.]|uniref:MBL fold metallo-hydrolase n=1 Tax=Pararhizobium sp. TaxID=1977563 RepID=UPI002C3FAFCD|nr:MBL fold metallo-hydrolase [Pararhizobium sp.]HTO33151.1 MBL fold metallo-hydrolase [Pararhizobium sp.]